MKTFGESDLHDKVSTGDNLASVVKVVEQLPDPIATPDGVVFQLMNSQPGYVATHVYLCTNNQWVDITTCRTVAPDATGLYANGYLALYDGLSVRLYLWWNSPEDTEDDKWEYDMVVMKLDEMPSSILDGIIVTRSVERGEYSEKSACYLSGVLGREPTGRTYKFRVFHVFASGAVTYTDCNIDDDNAH